MSLELLNTAQRKAVTAGDGPALVLAGAGSGKTRVIVERLVWLIHERGVDPRNLLALTFTNRAADEMRGRVAGRLEVPKLASWVGTFHSFGLFVLRRDIDKLGRSKDLTIFDDSDQLSLTKQLAKDLPAKFPKVSPRAALHWISRLKQDLASPDPDQFEIEEETTYAELWTRYHRALAQAKAVDFDDLLVLSVRLLQDHPEVRDKYQQRYRHVLIDEYQDTNRAQYQFARHLSDAHSNIFAVGDEDQSIYSWRGADINNILSFERDFPQAVVYRLEQNYRSTAPILAVANAVVQHNRHRLGKTLFTERKQGDPARYFLAGDEQAEARFVADDITNRRHAPRDVAILFRTNGQSRVIEDALRLKGLAYVVIGGVKFYARKEIKDILAYLRLLVNPADDVSLRRVINVPARGIGATSLEVLEQYAAQRQVPLYDVVRDIEHDQALGQRLRDAATTFVHLLDELAQLAKTASVSEVAEAVLARTGYREYVAQSDEKDFRTRLEVVDEFLSSCRQFEEGGGNSLLAFLQELALYSDVDQLEPGAPVVTLLTCHSAKGLEFDHVYLVGLEEGLLPHASALDSDLELEEERRLCYVAMTRARTSLTLASAESRLLYGKRRPCEVSRFVGEVPSGLLEVAGGREGARPTAMPAAPAIDATRLRTGTRVRHAQFGPGTVMYTMGSGSKVRARIRFNTGMTRQFLISATPLEILDKK
jgi:DNA helicase II / ATP-dependent DNA helicase PcrA